MGLLTGITRCVELGGGPRHERNQIVDHVGLPTSPSHPHQLPHGLGQGGVGRQAPNSRGDHAARRCGCQTAVDRRRDPGIRCVASQQSIQDRGRQRRVPLPRTVGQLQAHGCRRIVHQGPTTLGQALRQRSSFAGNSPLSACPPTRSGHQLAQPSAGLGHLHGHPPHGGMFVVECRQQGIGVQPPPLAQQRQDLDPHRRSFGSQPTLLQDGHQPLSGGCLQLRRLDLPPKQLVDQVPSRSICGVQLRRQVLPGPPRQVTCLRRWRHRPIARHHTVDSSAVLPRSHVQRRPNVVTEKPRVLD